MKRTAAVLLALLTMAGQAQAQPRIISKEVGPLLRQAQALIVAKNYKAALVKVNQAEAVKSTSDDATVINQFRVVIAAASLDPTQPQCTSAGMGITRCDGRRVTGVQR
jgi:hypothetical protein